MGRRKPTSIYIDEDLLKAVKRAGIDRGTNQTEAIDRGLRIWLGGEGAGGSIQESPQDQVTMSDEELEYVNRALAVLRAGQREAVKCLYNSLEIGELLVNAFSRKRHQ